MAAERETARLVGASGARHGSPLPKPWTVDDFLAWEAQQPERYEFIDGMVFMMVGGSAAHTIIKDNVDGRPPSPPRAAQAAAR